MNLLNEEDSIDTSELERQEREQARQQSADVNIGIDNDAVDTVAPPSCCRRFMAELNPCQAHFAERDAATGREFDIPESFAPPATIRVVLFKFFVAALSIGTFAYYYVEGPGHHFLLFLTNWGLFYLCLYSLMSLLNTIMAERTPQLVGLRIKTTWILAQVATQWHAIVTVNFWVLIHDWNNPTNGLDFHSLAAHGGLGILALVDTLWVNRIPFRWYHWICYVVPLELMWVAWSAIHNLVTDIGNDYRDGSSGDPGTNDDVIYDQVDWNNEWEETAIISAITIFGLGPVLFLVLWLLSIYSWPLCCCGKDRRRYVDSYLDNNKQRGPTVNDVEEGSIFQTAVS